MRIKPSSVSLGLAVLFSVAQPFQASAYSYNLSAYSIYQQAQNRNQEYFQLLRRYSRAIDLTDASGDTAYCMALKARDMRTARYLASEGANVRHSCVRRMQSRQVSENQNVRPKYRNSGAFEDNRVLWLTVGGVALVGGGIAALASSGGGGSSSHSSGGGGYTPDNPKTDPSVDPYDTNDELAKEFITDEYKKTNALGGIKAAEAYSHIYTKDENGNLVSHQANSNKALAKIKVGVLDSGMYTNSDVKNKIIKNVDINDYNNMSNVWGHISNGVKTYVILEDGSYYLMQITKDKSGDDSAVYYGDANGLIAISADKLNNVLRQYGVNFSDMTLMNSGNGGNPGTDESIADGVGDYIDWLNAWYAIAETLSHGTHVAGVIAGEKNDSGMHGVAFENAEIYNMSWDMQQGIYDAVKGAVDSGVTVLNNSWGTPVSSTYNADTAARWLLNNSDDDTIDTYVYAAKNGAVWVQATGNEGQKNATLQNGIAKLDLKSYGYSGPGKYEVPYVAVTALDLSTATESAPSGKLADYANWCGSAKGYCVAAPGTDIESTGAVKSGTLQMSGTSMATPVVSGSIALLNGYYPWLSAQNVAWLLLETANNKGEYANSQKYGRGALDLEAAITTPIGDLGLATSSNVNQLTSAKNNRLAVSGAMQNKIVKAMPSSVTAFDELHRPFAYDTSKLMTTTHGSNANFRNQVSRAAIAGPKKVVKDEQSGFQFSSSEMLNKGGQANLATMEIKHETEEGSSRFYYAENSKYTTSDKVVLPDSNPYFAMNEAYGAENVMNLSDVSRLKLSLQTGENGLYERDYEQDRQSFNDRSYAFGAEYSFNMTDYLELAATGGMLYEENAMLGLNGQGGFSIRDGSTYYMGLKAALQLTPKVSLLAAYYRGYTQGREAMMMSISDLETESYMIAGEYKINGKEKIGLSLATPLSVRKGKASFSYASGRDNYSDTVYMQKLTSSLKPAAKEYDLGLYYQGEPKEDLSFTGKLEARFNADGEKGVTDYMGIMGISKSF